MECMINLLNVVSNGGGVVANSRKFRDPFGEIQSSEGVWIKSPKFSGYMVNLPK